MLSSREILPVETTTTDKWILVSHLWRSNQGGGIVSPVFFFHRFQAKSILHAHLLTNLKLGEWLLEQSSSNEETRRASNTWLMRI